MLQGKRIAILATNGFEQSELQEPLKQLRDVDAEVNVVSLEPGTIRGESKGEWGNSVPVDQTIDEVSEEDFDALVIPGGLYNPDQLRANPEAVLFVRAMFNARKPVAAICHGPWLLVEAGIARGRKLTSYPSIRTDITNAGGLWLDEPVVVDQGLITSRSPDDLQAFIAKIVEETREGRHEDRITKAA
jgi:protease I